MGVRFPPVTLNVFQHPCAATCPMGVAAGFSDRAWTLKHVQGDEYMIGDP